MGLKNVKSILIASMFLQIAFSTNINVRAESKFSINRLSGKDRYHTSIEVANKGWNSTSKYLVLTTGEDFPDSLSAVPLAKKYSAPILLTDPLQLPKDVEKKIDDLKVENIFIVGGEGVVSKDIEEKLKNKNIQCTRISGNDRYETSLEIAKYLGNTDMAFLATGENFPDALSIASYAASKQVPILLMQKDEVPEKIENYISSNNINKIYVIGGNGVISDEAVKSLTNVERISGNDRYETNRNILNKFSNDISYETTYFATGENFPDAISGATLAAITNSPIILTSLESDVDAVKYVKAKKNSISSTFVFGGNNVVPEYIMNRFFMNDEFITAEDYLSKVEKYSYNSIDGFNLLAAGLLCYPFDAKLNEEVSKRSPALLEKSRLNQNNDKYEEAIAGYNLLINSSAPFNIRTEAKVCKLLAEEGVHVIPKYKFLDKYSYSYLEGLAYYKSWNVTYLENLKYEPLGDYFNFSETRNYHVGSDVKFDNNGVPLVKWYNEFYYNPVAICQYALSQQGKLLKGENTAQTVINCADFIVNYIDAEGALRYPIDYYHYHSLNPGWTSSMSQGQTLSLMARAYMLTKNPKYIQAGNRALNYLLKPISEGGVMDTLEALDPSLKDYVFFQEYVTNPSSYTLNGFIYTLAGLYDWSCLPEGVNSEKRIIAKNYFNRGVSTLKVILPYYDLGGFTSYDLMYMNTNRLPTTADFYHCVHIEQLEFLYYVTKDPFFNKVRELWSSYVPQ